MEHRLKKALRARAKKIRRRLEQVLYLQRFAKIDARKLGALSDNDRAILVEFVSELRRSAPR